MKIDFDTIDIIIADVGAPDRVSQVIVSWSIVPVHTGLESVSFQIERSLSPQFSDDEVDVVEDGISGETGNSIYQFTDITANLINFWRQYFYRVRAISEDEAFYSKVVTWTSSPRVYELDIIDRHDMVLRQFTGQPCFAFIERTTDGIRCDCFSITLGRSTESNCTTCLNTGWLRPYMEPILTFVDFNPTDKKTDITPVGEMQTNQKQCWWSAFPILKPGDIIYQCKSATLWRIEQIGPVEPQGVNIQQTARISAYNRDEIEYRRLRISDELLLGTLREWEVGRQGRHF